MILDPFHTSVLLPQVIESLDVKKGQKYIDATVGGGGYANEILKLGGRVLGIDADQDAIDYLKQKYQVSSIKYQADKNLILEKGNFRNIEEIAKRLGFSRVAGILFDLGMSSYQIEKSGRGFSYQRDEPLDMRLDKKSSLTAAKVINSYKKEDLYEIFAKYSEEIHSRTISAAIFRARSLGEPILTTKQLVEIIERVLSSLYPKFKKEEFSKIRIKTLSRVFQSLRIEVNDEINNLKKGLSDAIDLLGKDGRVVVLAYHSLEDRIVKLKLKQAEASGLVKILTTKAIRPDINEISTNPKSRSAVLRIAQKL